MTTYGNSALIMTIAMAFTACAPVNVPNEQYQSAARHLASELDARRRACKSLPRDSIGLCRAEVHREYQVASGSLHAVYNPGSDASYKARIAIANAEYMVARRKCDGKVRDVKRSCLNQARAAQIAANAAADSAEDTSLMKRTLDRKAAAERKETREEDERMEGRKDSLSEKRNTELHISIDRCDTLPTTDRLACITEADTRFGPL